MRHLAVFGLLFAMTGRSAAEEATAIKIGYLQRSEQKPAISLLDVPAANAALAAPSLRSRTTIRPASFSTENFPLPEVKLGQDEDPAAASKSSKGEGISLVVTDLPGAQLLKAADAGRSLGMLFLNAAALSDSLREEDCRGDVIHVAPSRAMLADGLAQYLIWKQWRNWVLVTGSHPEDKLWADALKRAALRFGAKIADEKVFEDKGGARQTDSGIAEIQLQIPLFTQGLPDYDVLVAADESAVFADYLPYRTKAARPVACSRALSPQAGILRWNSGVQRNCKTAS